MAVDISSFSIEEKYDFLKQMVEGARKHFGNEDDETCEVKEGDKEVNLVGIRGFKEGKPCKSTKNTFDDTMFIFFKDGDNKCVKEYKLSTEYGTNGDGLLILGQHKYFLNFHKKQRTHKSLADMASYQKSKYRALNPYKDNDPDTGPACLGVKILRDSNRNLKKDETEAYEYSVTHNIHYGGESENPTSWTNGCQVLQKWTNYKDFIEQIETDTTIIGVATNELATADADNGSRPVIYTLIDDTLCEEFWANAGSRGYKFPVNIGGKQDQEPDVIEKYHSHVENSTHGGYFPIALNGIWHGGVHLESEKGTPIVAMADGEVVAARLASSEDQALKEFGSRNFILVKHILAPKDTLPPGQEPEEGAKSKVYYSLYCHLNREPFETTNEKIDLVHWLPRATTEYKVLKKFNFRSSAKVADDNLLGSLAPDDMLTIMDDERIHANGYNWVKVSVNSGDLIGQEGYIALLRGYLESKLGVDPDIVTKFDNGEVVKFEDLNIKYGDTLWFSGGQYGDQHSGKQLIHWEIFSEENLFEGLEGWTAVEDTSANYNIENNDVLDLVTPEGGFPPERISPSTKNVRDFYQSEQGSALRKHACKFESEWGLDVSSAIAALDTRWETEGLQEAIEPYLWWADAQSAGVELPAATLLWHYNPIELLKHVKGLGRTPMFENLSWSVSNAHIRDKIDLHFKTNYLEKGDKVTVTIYRYDGQGARQVLNKFQHLLQSPKSEVIPWFPMKETFINDPVIPEKLDKVDNKIHAPDVEEKIRLTTQTPTPYEFKFTVTSDKEILLQTQESENNNTDANTNNTDSNSDNESEKPPAAESNPLTLKKDLVIEVLAPINKCGAIEPLITEPTEEENPALTEDGANTPEPNETESNTESEEDCTDEEYQAFLLRQETDDNTEPVEDVTVIVHTPDGQTLSSPLDNGRAEFSDVVMGTIHCEFAEN